jgi:hypothetical protein
MGRLKKIYKDRCEICQIKGSEPKGTCSICKRKYCNDCKEQCRVCKKDFCNDDCVYFYCENCNKKTGIEEN